MAKIIKSDYTCRKCNVLKQAAAYYPSCIKVGKYLCRPCHNMDKAKREHRNIVTKIIATARKRARKENIPFSLTPDDIHIPKYCPLLGIKLRSNYTGIPTGTASHNSPSLDRIYPDKGYIPGNVIVISHRANTIKNSATPQQLIAIARALYDITTNHYPLTADNMKSLWPEPYENPMTAEEGEGGGERDSRREEGPVIPQPIPATNTYSRNIKVASGEIQMALPLGYLYQ